MKKDGGRSTPPLENIGASTWGLTQEAAIKNIQEVLSMILEEFEEDGQPIPITKHMIVSEGALVAVAL
jgi:predicted RNase H-like HicB family nuclease